MNSIWFYISAIVAAFLVFFSIVTPPGSIGTVSPVPDICIRTKVYDDHNSTYRFECPRNDEIHVFYKHQGGLSSVLVYKKEEHENDEK